MRVPSVKYPFFLALLLVVALCGCVKRTTPFGWPWEGPTTDFVAGLSTPAEQIDTIRGMGQSARSAGPERRQQMAFELASWYQREEDPMIRAELVQAIGGCRTEESVGVLSTALNDSNAEVRIAACEGCGRLGGAPAVAMLGQALNGDVDIDVRQTAARALGRTQTENTAFVLSNALEDRDPAIRHLVINSLQQVTGRNFGNNVQQWQQYVQGGIPETNSTSIVQRVRDQLD